MVTGSVSSPAAEARREREAGSTTTASPASTQIPAPNIVARPRRRMLVTWSGGLDSTYGLVRVLRETDDEIHVHHIHRYAPHDFNSDPAQSCRYEAAAVGRMLPLIRERYRDFSYSESVVDNTAFPQFAPDATTVLLFAGCVAKKLGLGAEDRILDVMNKDEDGDWGAGSMSGMLLRMNSLHILKLMWQTEDVPPLYTYDGIPTKAEEVAYLPSDLVEMNASCRSPQLVDGTWRSCGVCRKCRSFARMGVALPADPENGDDLRARDDEAQSGLPMREVEVRLLGARKRLVMWSGGENSTAALVRILRDTEDPVHVLHILGTSRADRHPDEVSFGGHSLTEVRATLADLRKHHRPFRVTMSAIGPDRVVSHTHRANVVAYFAAQAALSWRMQSIDRVVVGSWGGGGEAREDQPALYRSGEVLAPQLLKAVMRSEEGPSFSLG